MSDTSTIEDKDRKTKLEEFYFQRRILFGCTVAFFVATILWIVAMSTNRWIIVSGGKSGIYVESHRRYFMSSHTGIWKYCRYALIPQPVASYVVRNLTTLACSQAELKKYKKKLEDEKFFNDFKYAKKPNTGAMLEIDEDLRRFLFAQWILNKEESPDFNEAYQKLHSLLKAQHAEITNKVVLDPSNRENVTETIGELISKVGFNQTSDVTFVVPSDLRKALFDKWEDQGLNIVRLLFHYAKSLGIDQRAYLDNTQFVFQAPIPKKRGVNGFMYSNWNRCVFINLFADDAALKLDPSVDDEMLDYSRIAATFSIFTIFVMGLGNVFTVYTFLNPRYMFKRLAGGMHFIAGATASVVLRTMTLSIEHARKHLAYTFPDGAEYKNGYAFYFGALVAGINFFSFIMFMWYSRKKKGNKAATEELGMADEEIVIGR